MLTIYDVYGRTRSRGWLEEEFGRVVIETPRRAGAAYYEIVELRENDDVRAGEAGGRAAIQAVEAPACVIVTVLDAEGQPVAGIEVAWSWPDAPHDPGTGWTHHAVIGHTNTNGHVGHAMGGGAYYDPKTGPGPHSTWIAGEGTSQMIAGLGMIGGTNHDHIDVTFKQADPPSPQPQPGPDLDKLLLNAEEAYMHTDLLHEHLNSIIRELLTYRCAGD